MQGVILSAFFWSYALLNSRRLADRPLRTPRPDHRRDRRLGLLPGHRGGATGGISLLVSRVGLGAAEAPLFPAGAKLNSIWLSSKERARGAVLVDSGAPLGAAFGGVIIAWLILSLGSWRTAFVVAGLATICRRARVVVSARRTRRSSRRQPG